MRSAIVYAAFSSTGLPIDLNAVEVEKNLGLKVPHGLDLTHAKIGLRILAAIGEASDIVAPLKTVALIGLEIAENAERAIDNQERCKSIAEDVFKLMESIDYEAFELDPTDHKMRTQVQSFITSLAEINAVVAGIARRGSFKKGAYAESDSGELDRCDQKLDRCRDLLVVQLLIENRKNMGKLRDLVEAAVGQTFQATA